MSIFNCREAPRNERGTCCNNDRKKVGGIFLVATGVVLVILAALFASGVFTSFFKASTSAMHFTAAGLTIGSLIPFIIGGVWLARAPRVI